MNACLSSAYYRYPRAPISVSHHLQNPGIVIKDFDLDCPLRFL